MKNENLSVWQMCHWICFDKFQEKVKSGVPFLFYFYLASSPHIHFFYLHLVY